MRIEQLTFTRFIAAISIVIFHYGKDSFLFNNEYISFIFQQANVCVSYFFILSGFVMIIAYKNQENINFGKYIKNRLARIYPVYILAIFLILGIALFRDVNISDLLLNIFMIQSWIPQKALTINFTGWSLSVELFFYITFPFLINKIYNKSTLKINAYWIIIFWLISQIVFHLIINNNIQIPYYEIKDIYYNPFMHLNEFLIGNLTGMFFIDKLKNKEKNYLHFILLTILLLIILLKFPIGLSYHNGFLAIIYVPLILFISLSNDKITKVLTHNKFVFLGEISFGIYILQVPVWTMFSDYRMEKYFMLHKESDFTTSFIIRLFILIIISSLSYVYLEKPLRNRIKKTTHNSGLQKWRNMW